MENIDIKNILMYADLLKKRNQIGDKEYQLVVTHAKETLKSLEEYKKLSEILWKDILNLK